MTKAAGILIREQKGESVLFLKRGPGSDYPGHWCFPGGGLEDGETIEQCAIRECKEEIGSVPKGDRAMLVRTILSIAPPPAAAPGDPAAVDSPPTVAGSDPVDFTTFLQVVPDKFEVVRDGEHVGYAWAPADQPPEPLHPGCRIALQMLSCDELGIARLMAAGQISSPHRYKNVSLFKMRITGTGVAFRREKKDDKGKVIRGEEFAFRDPSLYLNEDFLARCNGLAVIYYHPEKSVLNSKEFAQRIVGTIMLPFIQGNEVWGIAKIYDDGAIEDMSDPDNPMSTSPAIVLGDPRESTRLKMDDGAVILIEGKPSLLDHLAICERGVWDKGGEPTGIIINDSNTETEMDKTEVVKLVAEVLADADGARAKADAENGQKLDKLLDSMGGFGKRMDAVCERMDAFEKKGEAEEIAADKSKKDAEEKEEADKKAKADAEAKEKEEKDKADADKKEEEEKAKADSDIKARIADVEKRMPVHLADADYAALTSAQADADHVFQAFGDSAPRPLNGESVMGYRKRVATTLKAHSQDWKGVDVVALADDAFVIAEKRIMADASTAALHPTDIPAGTMRPITRTDPVTGHRVTTFAGRQSFVRDFSQNNRRVTAFKQRRSDRE